VRSIAARMRVVPPSTAPARHSSSTIAMSEPSDSWIATVFSGVSCRRLPSTGDAKVTPSSSTRAFAARDVTW
jgi:hypothetical protein